MPPPAIHISDLDTNSISRNSGLSADSRHLVDTPRGLSLPPAIRSSVPPSLVATPSLSSPILNAASTESNAPLEALIPSKVHPNSTSSEEVKVNIQPRRSTGRRKLSGTTKPLLADSEDQNSIERPKRIRTTPKVIDTNQVEGDGRPVTSVSIRSSRPPSLPPYDADADPGEDIDPTVVTMAALCSDSGQGRVSSKAVEILNNHAAWKAQSREKRARMRSLMEAKKYGRDEDRDHQDSPTSNVIPALPESSDLSEPTVERAPSNALIVDDTGHGFDYSQNMATSRYNVQVRIGPNGETIIDEESLVVDRADADETENYTHIIESDHTKFVNSGTYGKRYRGSRWSAEETELFYEVC
jgi:transcription factor TFIIIB component B''